MLIASLALGRSANVSLSQLVGMVDEEKKWKSCKDRDPCFLLDVQFLRYHAEKLLHARCLWSIWECLPSIDVLLTLQQSLDRIKELQQSPMLQDGQLGEDILLLDEIVGHLNMMQHAEGPTLSASASQTKRQLFQKYTLFFRWKVVEDTIDGAEGRAEVRSGWLLQGDTYGPPLGCQPC